MYLIIPSIIIFIIFLAQLFFERRTIWVGIFALLSLACVVALLLYFGLTYELFYLNIMAAVILTIVLLPIPIYFIGFIVILIYSGIVLLIKEGFRIRNLLSLVLGSILILWVLLPFLNLKIVKHPMILLSSGWISLMISYFLFQMVIFYLASVINGHYPLRRRYDYIIILGSGLIGEKVPPLLAGRIDRAIAIYRKQSRRKRSPKLIFSGGKGSDEVVSEGFAMQQYAIQKGVKDSDTLIEDQSKNTFENINNSILLTGYQQKNTRRLKYLVVTSSFHLLRALIWSRKLKVKCDGRGSKVKYYFWINAFIREFVAMLQLYRWTHIFFIILITTVYLIFFLQNITI